MNPIAEALKQYTFEEIQLHKYFELERNRG